MKVGVSVGVSVGVRAGIEVRAKEGTNFITVPIQFDFPILTPA